MPSAKTIVTISATLEAFATLRLCLGPIRRRGYARSHALLDSESCLEPRTVCAVLCAPRASREGGCSIHLGHFDFIMVPEVHRRFGTTYIVTRVIDTMNDFLQFDRLLTLSCGGRVNAGYAASLPPKDLESTESRCSLGLGGRAWRSSATWQVNTPEIPCSATLLLQDHRRTPRHTTDYPT